MENKDKRPPARIRNNRRSYAASVSSKPTSKKKLSVVAVSVALSLGLGYQAIAATEDGTTPFSKESLGVTAPTTAGTITNNSTTGTTTQPTATTAGLTPNGQTNLGSSNASSDPSAIPFDPSAAVLANAQSCAEDMKTIREENLVRDIEMADAGFDVDVFFKDMRSSGCLVSIQDSISLANQITSLSGGSISSMIMSQVESKIRAAGEQMLQKVFDKGCEVMLEASQGVYGPINEVVKKYGVYGNPDMVGNTVGGLIDGVADEAMFNFDAKLDEIGDQIMAKNDANDSGGSGSSGDGSLLPPATDGLGSSTGGQNIGDAEKAAAQQTVEDLADSRNSLVYPYYETRREVWKTDSRTGNRYVSAVFADISLHTLNNDRPKGVIMNSIQNGRVSNDSNAVCVYVAQVTSINNEIIRIVNSKGVQNTTLNQVKPMNLSPAYWTAANQYIRNVSNGSADCAQDAIAVTPPTTIQEADSSAVSSRIATVQQNSTIDYGSATASSSLAMPSQPQTSTNTVAPVSTSPTTNEATQYMQDRQTASSTGVAPAEEPVTSSNPFSKMRNLFN